MVRTIVEASNEKGRRIVIAGEMLELGSEEQELHRQAGREIAALRIDVLWGVRGLARDILVGANEGGLVETRFFDSSLEAATAIIEEARAGDLVLVKGSRGVETDKIVKALRGHFVLAGEEQKQQEQ